MSENTMATETETMNETVVESTPTTTKKSTTPKRRPSLSRNEGKESRVVTMRANAAKNAVVWAHRYTTITVLTSSALNSYSAVRDSGADSITMGIAAGTIGALVPVLVWVLGTMVAWTYRAGWKRLAYISGAIACCILALSVVHVAAALAALTGVGWLLSGLLAIGIDCGLVASEATAILVSMD